MMTQQDYKEMIHNIVVSASLPDEEINKRYQPIEVARQNIAQMDLATMDVCS